MSGVLNPGVAAAAFAGVELLGKKVGGEIRGEKAFSPCWVGSRATSGVALGRGRIRCEAAGEKGILNAEEVGPSSRISSVSVLEQLKASGSAGRYARERSSLAVIGLSVHTAPVEMREKLAIPEAQWSRAVQELCDLFHIEEAAVLSTCNRMEIYVVALSWHQGIREVIQWMAKISGIPVSELWEHLFLLGDSDATRHLFEVAAGLDSLVLGEGQILSQVKQVVRIGSKEGGLGKYIDRLFKHAITCGKRVRSETNISSGAVSISSASVELAFMKLPTSYCSSAKMLVIGAGKMGKLVIKHLAAKGCKNMVVVNRSEERVAAIREEMEDVEIVYKNFSEIISCAGEADVIFTCTASETPLFFNENVEHLRPPSLSMAGTRIFIDISVPRNVESSVSKLETVQLFNVDDLKEVVEANKEDRLRKVQDAQIIITEELKHFQAWSDSLETVPTIRKLKQYMDGIKDLELARCLEKIGDEALTNKIRKAVNDLSKGIVNKVLHGPLQHLRCDGSDDSQSLDETLENMYALNRIFELDTRKAILEEKIKFKLLDEIRGTIPSLLNRFTICDNCINLIIQNNSYSSIGGANAVFNPRDVGNLDT